MHASPLIAFIALAASAVAAIDIPAEHHERFLREQVSLLEELNEWKASEAGQVAKEHGFYTEPASDGNEESAVIDTENLKRLFLTKVSMADAQAANPEAVLSLNSPFTLMTDDEFAAYVKRSSGGLEGIEAFTAANNATRALREEEEVTARNLATSVDWTTTGCVSGVKDQGNCGSCWAFSAVGAIESAYCLKKGALTLFSDQQVTSCDPNSYGCDGGWQSYGMSYVKSAGFICTQASYPYKSGTTGTTGTCSTSSCTKTTMSISSVVTISATETALVNAIAIQPVGVAVAAGNTAWKQYTSGVLSACGTTTLDHAVLAVGYDSTSFLVKNQWGTSWGNAGYINLKRNGASSACSVINSHNAYPKLS